MEAQVTAEDIFKQFRDIVGIQAQEIASLRALLESMQKDKPQP
jgi:hypothetical protein